MWKALSFTSIEHLYGQTLFSMSILHVSKSTNDQARIGFWNFAMIRIAEMVFLFFNCFSKKLTNREIQGLTGLSQKTIFKGRSQFRDLLANYYTPEGYGLLGDGGEIIEIDEAKFKRKGNVGRLPKSGWVFGIAERGQGGLRVMVSVPDRSAATLMPIIRRWVSPQATCIISDEWRAYSRLRRIIRLPHFTVNHSRNIVNPLPHQARNVIRNQLTNIPVHTQTIEGYCAHVRRLFKGRGGIRMRFLQGFLNESAWSLENDGDLEDSMIVLIQLYNF